MQHKHVYFYELLGVTFAADPAEIKSAWRRLALEVHPDRNSQDPEAGERFKRAREAYDVLSDPAKRALYDEFGPDGLARHFDVAAARAQASAPPRSTPPAPPPASPPSPPPHRRRAPHAPKRPEKPRPAAPKAPAPAPAPRRAGLDIDIALEVDTETLAAGGSVPVFLWRSVPCETCDGVGSMTFECDACDTRGLVTLSAVEPCWTCGCSGLVQIRVACSCQKAPRPPKKCPTCHGEGTVMSWEHCGSCAGMGQLKVTRDVVCVGCSGVGRVTRPCPGCEGTGSGREERNLTVRIPAGVEDGTSLRLPGLGARRRDGEMGDVFITVKRRGR